MCWHPVVPLLCSLHKLDHCLFTVMVLVLGALWCHFANYLFYLLLPLSYETLLHLGPITTPSQGEACGCDVCTLPFTDMHGIFHCIKSHQHLLCHSLLCQSCPQCVGMLRCRCTCGMSVCMPLLHQSGFFTMHIQGWHCLLPPLPNTPVVVYTLRLTCMCMHYAPSTHPKQCVWRVLCSEVVFQQLPYINIIMEFPKAWVLYCLLMPCQTWKPHTNALHNVQC